MILVTGATGTTGFAAVQALVRAGLPVRAMVRRPEQAARFAAPVQVAVADMRVPASLPSALAGVQQMLLISPLEHALPELQAGMAEAARRARVRRIVKVSTEVAGPHSADLIGRWHGQAEQAVQATGLAWHHLRPCNFMQNLLSFARGVAADGRFWSPLGDARISLIDARDVGLAAATVLGHPEAAWQGGAVKLTGTDRPTYDEFAALLTRALGRSIVHERVDDEEARRRFLAGGMPAWKADALVFMYRFLQEPRHTELGDALPRLTGVPARTLVAFVEEHATGFANRQGAHG